MAGVLQWSWFFGIVYFVSWRILWARCDCLLNVFVLEIHHISLQNYCRCHKICPVYEIFWCKYKHAEGTKSKYCDEAAKWFEFELDNALLIVISHVTAEMPLTYLKFCSLPLTFAKLECVRKSFHDISLLQSWLIQNFYC